jgi:hypothetical protein
MTKLLAAAHSTIMIANPHLRTLGRVSTDMSAVLLWFSPPSSMSPTTDLKQVSFLAITFLVDNSIEWSDRHLSISSELQSLIFQDDKTTPRIHA